MSQIDLNNLKIASPCPMEWNQMKGDDRKRFCASCKLSVYNLAGMTRTEAEQLFTRSQNGERLCMRLLKRADGTVVTKDCPVGMKLARRMKLKLTALRLSLVSLLWIHVSANAASTNEDGGRMLMGKVMPHYIDKQEQPQALMGDVTVPPEEREKPREQTTSGEEESELPAYRYEGN